MKKQVEKLSVDFRKFRAEVKSQLKNKGFRSLELSLDFLKKNSNYTNYKFKLTNEELIKIFENVKFEYLEKLKNKK